MGLYISGLIYGVSVEWIIDIGVIKLIILKKVFEKILKDFRLKLKCLNFLIGVNGELLKEFGRVIFKV